MKFVLLFSLLIKDLPYCQFNISGNNYLTEDLAIDSYCQDINFKDRTEIWNEPLWFTAAAVNFQLYTTFSYNLFLDNSSFKDPDRSY